MSYCGTIYKLPRRVRTYAKAKEIHDKTKPIRNTNTRPFGARRDHDKYSIEMVSGSDDVLVYYGRRWASGAFITYHADDTITIKRATKWGSSLAHQVIEWVLGIPTDGRLSRTNLTINGGKYALNYGEELKVRWSDNKWELLTIKEYHDWRINRKGANNVRARYKAFADYLKGFVSLRTEQGEEGENPVIYIPISEYVEAFPERVEDAPKNQDGSFQTYAQTYRCRDNRFFRRNQPTPQVFRMPTSYNLRDKSEKHYREDVSDYLFLVLSNDSQKWYKAALIACAPKNKSWHEGVWSLTPDNVHFLSPSQPTKFFEEVILKLHSDEAFERVKLKQGQVPTHKYDGWVNKEEGGN